MKKRTVLYARMAAVLLGLAALICPLIFHYSPWLSVVAAIIWIAAVLLCVFFLVRYRHWLQETTADTVAALDPEQREVLMSFPLPAITVTDTGDILFANPRFCNDILGGGSPDGRSLYDLFPDLRLDGIDRDSGTDVRYEQLQLTAYVNPLPGDTSGTVVLYFVDNTALKNVAAEYTATRPVVLIICLDNLEDATHDLRDSERTHIAGQIETMLDEWIAAPGGILRKFGSDRFLAVVENRRLNEMTRERFSILDRVRTAFTDVGGGITLSVGVGQGKTLLECEDLAHQALDMALARGGDQAAVKTANGFDFYGGRSRGVERRTKVRSRVVASALRTLITSGDRVLVMGHRLSDLDSLGASAALASAARRLGMNAHAVVRREATMAPELLRIYPGADDLFMEPEEALDYITPRSLLIIVDTHTASRLDSPELYLNAKRVAIIDHHRKMVDYIADTALFYHEPSASSTCEMVAELLQYMGDGLTDKSAAEAMLAGIMLDTRNFVLRTGVRTFEAAAYLRRLGADTVAVKRLFAESLDTYQKKCDLVAQATIKDRVAVAMTDEDLSDRNASAAQAADELLGIQGVQASFVISRTGKDTVSISARSYGEYNVQLIMEAMGGGGHLTMAGTQIHGSTVEAVREQLMQTIRNYMAENHMS